MHSESQLLEKASIRILHPTDRCYSLFTEHKGPPYFERLALLDLLGSHDRELGKLQLVPGPGQLTLVKEDVPYSITAGLETVCHNLLLFIDKDRQWQDIQAKKKAVYEAHRANLLGEHYANEPGYSLLGMSEKDFSSLTSDGQMSLVARTLDSLREEEELFQSITIRGLSVLRNIKLRGQPLFDIEEYNSYCDKSKRFRAQLAYYISTT